MNNIQLTDLKRGSFTIEASFIFTFTLITIITLIQVAFIFHDNIIYKCAAYQYAIANAVKEDDFYYYNDGSISSIADFYKKHALLNNANINYDSFSLATNQLTNATLLYKTTKEIGG